MRILPNISFKGELSVAELLAAGAAASVAAAVFFNFGYFYGTNWSYVSLLSVQDIALGTLIAIPAIAGFAPMFANVFVDLTNPDKQKVRASAIIVTVVLVGGATILSFLGDSFFYICAAVAYAVTIPSLFVLAATFVPHTPYSRTLFLALMAATPLLLGAAVFYSTATNEKLRATKLVFASGEVTEARVMRVSSNFVFFMIGREFFVRKLSDVSSMSTVVG